jgi:hypothetical protein
MAYTNIDDPSAYFHTLLWTGNGADNRALTNDANAGNFKPDFVWVKGRNQAEWHNVYDSSRGVNKSLYPNSNYQEESLSETFESFDTNGFTVSYNSAYGSVFTNKNSTTYVAWQWKCNGGTTSTNTDGDITSTVQTNQDAGFSIVTYTGNTSNNQTVGHGLGVKPSVILIRNRTRVEDWRLNHQSINNGTGMIRLNSTDAYNTTGTTLMNVAPTSSVFNVSTDWSVNGNYPFVAYCFAEKQGYSKFGKYVGNGSTNGPFIYTGFKPAFLIMKETSSSGGNWVMFDNKRDTHNVTKHRLFPNLTNSDNTTRNYIDLLSNGFKLRDTDFDHNQSGETMIYMAFAENPFVTSTGVPTTAR